METFLLGGLLFVIYCFMGYAFAGLAEEDDPTTYKMALFAFWPFVIVIAYIVLLRRAKKEEKDRQKPS